MLLVLGLLLVAGTFVALLVSGVVYADATRRDPQPSNRLAWASISGATSFVGFLVPYVYYEQLGRLYLTVIKPKPIYTSPYEALALRFGTGIVISVLAVCCYLVGSRYGPLEADGDVQT